MGEGERLEDTEVTIAGRVMSLRKQGKLWFYDVHGEGSKVQVMLSKDNMREEDDFGRATSTVKRGDIVGIWGNPGKSKRGELSIFPTAIQILSPCLRTLPKSHTGLKNIVRIDFEIFFLLTFWSNRKLVSDRDT